MPENKKSKEKRRRAAVQVPGKRYCSTNTHCPEEDFEPPDSATCRTHLAKNATNRINRETEACLLHLQNCSSVELTELANDVNFTDEPSILQDLASFIQVAEHTPEGSGQAEDDTVDMAAERLAALDLQSVSSQTSTIDQRLPNGTEIQVHGLTKQPEVTQQSVYAS